MQITDNLQTRKHYKEVKKALKKDLLINLFTMAKYKLSPYTACGHGCLYCDGRAEKYYVQGDFELDIIIRKNIPDLLEKEIPDLREIGTVNIGSGTSDVYQPVEKEEGIMRRCAEIFAESNLPVSILTKSSLIMRDLDLWSKVNEKSRFILMITLTTIDDNIRRIFEPKASSVEDRLETIRAFKSKGCAVGVLCMPLLPMISDKNEEASKLFEKLKSLDVDFIMPGSLTLRPGIQKDIYLSAIESHFPHLIDGYSHIYSENRQSGMPKKAFHKDFNKSIFPLLGELSIPWLMPHRIYKNTMPVYDEIHVLMHQMIEIYGSSGTDISRLKNASMKYENWLTERKKTFNRRPSLDDNYITGPLVEMIESGGFKDLIENEKLAFFMKEVVVGGKIFDPLKRSLEQSHCQ